MNTIYNNVLEILKKEGWDKFPVTYERMRSHAEELASNTPLNAQNIYRECCLLIYRNIFTDGKK